MGLLSYIFPRVILNYVLWHLKLTAMRKKKSLKKRKEPKHPLLFARRESFSCNYTNLYVWLWRFIQSFTSRVACLLPQRDQLRTQSPPHLWEFKMPSDALTSTEAPWSLNSGIANSRKLYTSTNALFWHSKSCVLIHMFLYQKKKMQYSSCQWKVPNEKHLEPQTMF